MGKVYRKNELMGEHREEQEESGGGKTGRIPRHSPLLPEQKSSLSHTPAEVLHTSPDRTKVQEEVQQGDESHASGYCTIPSPQIAEVVDPVVVATDEVPVWTDQ